MARHPQLQLQLRSDVPDRVMLIAIPLFKRITQRRRPFRSGLLAATPSASWVRGPGIVVECMHKLNRNWGGYSTTGYGRLPVVGERVLAQQAQLARRRQRARLRAKLEVQVGPVPATHDAWQRPISAKWPEAELPPINGRTNRSQSVSWGVFGAVGTYF